MAGPAITRYGRSDAAREGRAGVAGAEATDADAAVVPVATRALCAPDSRITGNTGRMHGEKPVISPPTTPIAISVNISAAEPLPGYVNPTNCDRQRR